MFSLELFLESGDDFRTVEILIGLPRVLAAPEDMGK